MAAALLNQKQLDRLHVLYVTEGRPPSEIASILVAENEGLKLTSRQVTELVSTRGWGAKRKAVAAKEQNKAAALVAQTATAIAKAKAAAAEGHREFVEESVRIGRKAMRKAEELIDKTSSPRDLSSAVNAAAKGIEIFRAAVGLNDAPSLNAPTVNNNFFGFAYSAGSPFMKKVRPAPAPNKPAVDADVEVAVQSETPHEPQPEPAIHAASGSAS